MVVVASQERHFTKKQIRKTGRFYYLGNYVIIQSVVRGEIVFTLKDYPSRGTLYTPKNSSSNLDFSKLRHNSFYHTHSVNKDISC